MSARSSTKEERDKTNPHEWYRTPPYMTWNLIEWMLKHHLLHWPTHAVGEDRKRPVRILDAGAGDGSISLEVAHWSKCMGIPIDQRAIELQEKFRPGLEEILGAGRVKIGSFFDMEPTSGAALVDIVIHNPPFSLADQFLMHAKKWLHPGGSQFMLQRTTWPCETDTGRYLQIYDPAADDPIAHSGYRGELTGLNRTKFLRGGSDNINHGWFHLQDGWAGALPTHEYFLREPCPWDPEREPENPRQPGDYKRRRKQESLFT